MTDGIVEASPNVKAIVEVYVPWNTRPDRDPIRIKYLPKSHRPFNLLLMRRCLRKMLPSGAV